MIRRSLLAVMAITTLILGACGSEGAGPATSDGQPGTTAGGSSEAAPSTASIDPCELLTAEQVAAALGVEVGPAEASTAGPASTCAWFATSGPAGDGVTLTVFPPGILEVTLDAGDANGYLIEPVDGLGEAAYYQIPETSPTDATLSFIEGGSGFTVFLNKTSMNEAEVLEAELSLSRQVTDAL
jgi:hypothetical protein